MSVNTLSPAQMIAAINCGSSALGAKRKIVNDLNVFPIPDGDTGDNMYMTLREGCRKVSELPSGTTVGQIARAMSSGALMGARGNSGVILSRMIEGVAKGLDGVDSADAEDIRRALKSAVKEAYAAVTKPVEGTMLTVLKDAARAACSLGSNDIGSIFDIFCKEAEESVRRTPQLLEVLRQAGVVDSGGAGLFYIVQGMKQSLRGEALPSDETAVGSEVSETKDINTDLFTEDSILEFGYCTEFLLRLQSSKVDLSTFDVKEIIDYLSSVGESVVAFRDGSIVKVHVHTKTPGDILNSCQKWGEFLKLKIENMTLQHHGTQIKDNFAMSASRYGAVSVANGEGIEKMMYEAGADAVIKGGQTMNPSTEAFIEAFKKVNADTIFVFPNNSNIIMTAQQAASIYKDSDVRVVPTGDIGAGYIALASLDKSISDALSLEKELGRIAAEVTTILVCEAIRDARHGEVDVVKGNYVGIMGHEILCCCENAQQAVCQSLKIISRKADVALLLKGSAVSQESACALESELCAAFLRTEFILNDGGQLIYDYIIVLQ